MITKKAGTILINAENNKIALINRKDGIGYEFPKGHLEEGESLQECAVRETEEETERTNHLVSNQELDIIKYVTSNGEDVELYMYLAIDDGSTNKDIDKYDKEEWNWFDLDDVEENLNFQNLKDFWKKTKNKVVDFLGGRNG